MKLEIPCWWCNQIMKFDEEKLRHFSTKCENHFYNNHDIRIWYTFSTVNYKGEPVDDINTYYINVCYKQLNLYVNIRPTMISSSSVQFMAPFGLKPDIDIMSVIHILSQPIEKTIKKVSNLMAFL